MARISSDGGESPIRHLARRHGVGVPRRPPRPRIGLGAGGPSRWACDGRRLHFWGRDHGLADFFRDRGDDLFVAHSAVAEMKYLLRLGIPLPTRWFDTFVARRCVSNGPNKLEAGLTQALHELGLPHLAPIIKEEFAADHRSSVRRRRPRRSARDRRVLFLRLRRLRAVTRASMIGSPRGRWPTGWNTSRPWPAWGCRASPSTSSPWGGIEARKPAIRDALIASVNRAWPIYVDGSFRMAGFLAWCRVMGIPWPPRRARIPASPIIPGTRRRSRRWSGGTPSSPGSER